MADVNSTIVANRATFPRVANDPLTNARVKRSGPGSTAVDTNVDSGDKLSFCFVPSNASITAVLLSVGAGVTTGAADVGIYRTADDGGAVVDADFFASAQSLTSALSLQDVTHESGVYAVTDRNKPLWEALGLTEDPGVTYVVAATLTANIAGSDTVSCEVEYVDGGN